MPRFLDTLKHRIFLFSYYGGKSRLIRYYPPPRYKTIIEPFAGAASYSCAYFNRNVFLYELNPVVFGVLDFLIKCSKEDILKLPLLEKGQSVQDLNISQEAKNLIGFRVTYGAASPQNKLTSWALHKRGIWTSWNSYTRKNLAEFVLKIKHWKVFNESWESSFLRFGHRFDASWFIDPPYFGEAGNHYPFGSDVIDYDNLSKKILSLKGQTIVCEGKKATWLPFKPLLFNNRTQKKNSWEMIYTNSPTRIKGFGL